MKEQTVETLGALAVYAALYAAWNLAGGAFHVWPDLWQLMPWPALAADLGGAMLDLHSQPPLLNLIFGAALQASVATRFPMESLLQPLFFLVGAASVVALVGLARRLVARRARPVAVVLLFLANPYLYASLHYLFYTPIELLLLLLGGWLGFRFLDRPSPGRLAAALAPALLLVHARSIFHPLWLLLLLGLLLGLARPRLARAQGGAGRGCGPGDRLRLAGEEPGPLRLLRLLELVRHEHRPRTPHRRASPAERLPGPAGRLRANEQRAAGSRLGRARRETGAPGVPRPARRFRRWPSPTAPPTGTTTPSSPSPGNSGPRRSARFATSPRCSS